jgi:hypothetical protein
MAIRNTKMVSPSTRGALPSSACGWTLGESTERRTTSDLDELVAERGSQLDKRSAELEQQAQRLLAEIEELAGETPVRTG